MTYACAVPGRGTLLRGLTCVQRAQPSSISSPSPSPPAPRPTPAPGCGNPRQHLKRTPRGLRLTGNQRQHLKRIPHTLSLGDVSKRRTPECASSNFKPLSEINTPGSGYLVTFRCSPGDPLAPISKYFPSKTPETKTSRPTPVRQTKAAST